MTCPICTTTMSTVLARCDCHVIIRAEADAALSHLVMTLRLLSSHRDDDTAAAALALLDVHHDRDSLTAQTYQSLYLRIVGSQYAGRGELSVEWADVRRGARRVLDALLWVWRLDACRFTDRPSRLYDEPLTVPAAAAGPR